MTFLGTKPKLYDNDSNILSALSGMNSLTISSRLFRSLVTCCGNGPIGISYPAKLRCQCILKEPPMQYVKSKIQTASWAIKKKK